MRCIQRLFLSGIAIAPLLLVPTAQCDFINEDIQIVAPNATDFEILLRGNKLNQIGDRFISPFNNGAQVNFNNVNNTTAIVFNAPNGQNFGMGMKHFGFVLANAPFVEGGIGFGVPGVIAKLVSFGGAAPPPPPPPAPVPGLDIVLNDVVNNGQTSVMLQNLSIDTLSLFHVGYLVTSTAFPLENLNRTNLPPSAFLSAGIPDGIQLLPGQSDSFNLPAIPGQYITVFADSQFSGASSSNAYTGFVGDWVESQATVPEPATFTAVLAFLGLLGAARYRFGAGK